MEGPTFYHTTVLLKEAVDALAVKPDGIYADATFGGGGHSREILSRLGPKGKLIAFDHDADAWRNKPEDARFVQVAENFRYLKRFVRLHATSGKLDGILADLGVSSWQFDTPARGFSIRFDGPLDMRMDERLEMTAALVLQRYSEADLHRLFEQYGEVRNARQLARQIVTMRAAMPLESIEALKAMIRPVMRGKPERYLAQVFQALRIEVNDELGALRDFLEQAVDCLKPGGRLSIISFHSLEDRLVKTFMRTGLWVETRNEFGQVTSIPRLRPVSPKPIEPDEAEMKRNPRARSARLRIAEKTDET
ncbi:MAG: 16S rRNA (cytosine(1402)-N(4))-methyltransferase RsmH [Bacteroidetes bacterium]|nr:16S rRNA (cytosine(1402)-N(4))-methyltransferase RsmH [Bacteroidota bacterium]